ncbi:hypothetical protein SB758_33235, partial [Burkholderia sp. SIMBA_013]
RHRIARASLVGDHPIFQNRQFPWIARLEAQAPAIRAELMALLAERGLELLGMIIGSFKAGAGYLPLDPDLPGQRLGRIIELSRTPILVCTAACREQAQALLDEF